MAIAFGCRQRVRDTVQVDQQSSVIDGPGPEAPGRLGSFHLCDAFAEGLVHDVLERGSALGAQAFEALRDVVIQR